MTSDADLRMPWTLYFGRLCTSVSLPSKIQRNSAKAPKVANHSLRRGRKRIKSNSKRENVCVCVCVSCIRLVMHHQMLQECSHVVQRPDQPRELTATGSSLAFSQPASQGDPWPDVAPWQGQDSQLSLESTHGVDHF